MAPKCSANACDWKPLGRYVLAALTIPVGVALGVGGLAQNWSRALRGRGRRTAPEPTGFPSNSGYRRTGSP